MKPGAVPKPKTDYPCTQCGGDAFVGYAASKEPGGDWGGRVKPGERLCTGCFRKRGGVRFL